MNILMVCYSYPPMPSPRAYRWGAISRELVRQGHHVDVVCGLTKEATAEDGLEPHVHGVGLSLWATPRRWAWAGRPQTSCDSQVAAMARGAGGPGMAGRILRAWKRSLWDAWRWPDAQCHFIWPARRAVKRLLARTAYDVLVTVSFPFSDHLVGAYAKQMQPALPWLVDVGDPFALVPEVNNAWLYARLNRRVERAVLQQADHVTVTTGHLLTEYRRLGWDVSRMVVIPPLLSAPDFVVRVREPDGVVRLVYVGRLYDRIRSPARLLEVFSRLVARDAQPEKLELHFYGDSDGCERFFEPYRPLLNRHIFRHGQVPRSEATRALREADVLVNIGNTTSFQLPSKLVDCVATGKPIVHVSSHDHDSGWEWLASYPSALLINGGQDSSEAAATSLAAFLARRPRVLPRETVSRFIAPYTLPAIVSQYLELLECLARGRPRAAA